MTQLGYSFSVVERRHETTNEVMEVLVVWSHHFGGWVLPGGRVDPDAAPSCIQVGSLRRRTGLETNMARHLVSGPYAGASFHDFHAYLVTAFDGEPVQRAPERPVAWFSRGYLLSVAPLKLRTLYKHVFDIRDEA